MDANVGDLVVCVDAGPNRVHGGHGATRVGAVYTVAGFGQSRDEPFSLFLKEIRAIDESLGFGFALYRFRKIEHDKREACEPEFVTLVKRQPKRVAA